MRYLTFVFCFTVLSANLFAQKTGEIERNESQILKPFKAKVMESVKFNSLPDLPQLDTFTNTLEYSIPEHKIALKTEVPVVRSIPMPSEPTPPMYGFYTKLGFGTRLNPLAEISYHNKVSTKAEYGLSYRHFSAWKGDLENQLFNKNAANAQATFYTEKGIAVGGNLAYSNDTYYFYGHSLSDRDTVFKKEDIRQNFNLLGIGVHAFNIPNEEKKLFYRADINLHSLKDRFESQELGIGAKAKIGYLLGEKNNPLQIDLGVNSLKFSDTTTQNRITPYIAPSFTFRGEKFSVKLGAYAANDAKKWLFLPTIEANIGVMGEKLTVYAGWTGEVRINSFKSFSQNNPYILSELMMKNTVQENRFIGVKGYVSKLTYNIGFAQKPMKNLPLYVNDSSKIYHRFGIVYDTVNTINVNALTEVQILPNLSLGLQVDFNNYKPRNEEKAWHLPSLLTNVFVKYTPVKRLNVKMELFTRSGAFYRNDLGKATALKALVDLNLGVSYFLKSSKRSSTENFGLFLDLNNVLNQKIAQWYKYPIYGFNAMGGIILKF